MQTSRIVRAIIVGCTALILPFQASATDCSAWPRFSTTEDYLRPNSQPAAEVDDFLNTSEFSSGLVLEAQLHGDELWVDILKFPGHSSAAIGMAAIMKIGRLVDADFEKLVLADNGNPAFFIYEPVAREIGCQFIWGREGGQNPIYLMRILAMNLHRYETNALVATGFTGSLLGDTKLALSINTEILLPDWALSAVN